jgi:hypothetical protein
MLKNLVALVIGLFAYEKNRLIWVVVVVVRLSSSLLKIGLILGRVNDDALLVGVSAKTLGPFTQNMIFMLRHVVRHQATQLGLILTFGASCRTIRRD